MVHGRWHPKESASSQEALLTVSGGVYRLSIADQVKSEGLITSLQVSERLGTLERRVTFEDGSVFLTLDNDGIDEMLRENNPRGSLLYAVESRLHWALAALVVTVASVVLFFHSGIPWISQKVAHALPAETNQVISSHTLSLLDRYIFEPSALDAATQQKINQHFCEKILPLETHTTEHYQLHFRAWNDGNFSIPNALALPSGDIILTDKFVELAVTQDEIDAVLLHEMGHVVHRHGLEMVIENTFIAVVITLIVGDGTAFSDMGVGLGSFLLTSRYSRDHETEADRYAFEEMLKAKIDPGAFASIMQRMTAYIASGEPDRGVGEKSEEGVLDYFSSHPKTEARTEMARRYSDCYKAGKTSCKEGEE